MKRLNQVCSTIALAAVLLFRPSASAGNPVSITYQGRLSDGGVGVAEGRFDFEFGFWDAVAEGTLVAGPITAPAVTTKNGVFTVNLTVPAEVLDGRMRWLEIGVRTNGSSGRYEVLSPRQLVVDSLTAAATVADESATKTSGRNASPMAGLDLSPILAGINLFTGSNRFDGTLIATNAGNQVAGVFQGNGALLTNLSPSALNGPLNAAQVPNIDAAKLASGTVNDNRLSTNIPRLNGTNAFTGTNRFTSAVVATNPSSQFRGTFTGDGGGLTNLSPTYLTGPLTAAQIPNLDAAKLASGTVSDNRLSTNIPRLNGTNVFTGTNRFTSAVVATNPASQFRGTFTGDGGGLTNLSPASLVGPLTPAQVPNLDAAKITSGTLADARLSAAIARTADLSVAINSASNVLSARLVGTNNALVTLINSLNTQIAALASLQSSLSNRLAAVEAATSSGLLPGTTFVSSDPADPELLARGLYPAATIPAPAWQNGSTTGAPTARSGHTAVWTGQKMIVWGGRLGAASYSAAGAWYQPELDTWQPVSTVEPPSARGGHTAVWTESEMIIWGGFAGSYLRSGGRFSLAQQDWSNVTTTGAPSVRDGHVGVWTGNRMVIWGGRNTSGMLADGALYSPTNNLWSSLTLPNPPEPRSASVAVWAGDRMIVWGGEGTNGFVRTGGQLLFVNGLPTQWLAMNLNGAPAERSGHTVVWTGSQLLVWGGLSLNGYLGDGAAFNPVDNSWTPIAAANAPIARAQHTAVWTGSEMLIYGGETAGGTVAGGGAYDPVKNTWRDLTNPGNPRARSAATVIWTGAEAVFFGGVNHGSPLSALQRLTPQPTWYFFRKP